MPERDDVIEVEVGNNIAHRISNEVTINCGANTHKFDVAGLQIGEVADRIQEIMNIPSPRQTFVNGVQVRDNYVIKAGDEIEFIKPAGVKG